MDGLRDMQLVFTYLFHNWRYYYVPILRRLKVLVLSKYPFAYSRSHVHRYSLLLIST